MKRKVRCGHAQTNSRSRQRDVLSGGTGYRSEPDPWLLTGWQVRDPVPYWAPMRVLGVILLVAAAGFVIQIVSGVDVPTVPPGLVIMLVAASLVAFLPWRWIPVVGAAVGLFLLVAFFASGAVGSLLDPSRSGVF